MASARLLDLTRLVSRLGRGPLTGIDRVELAYLDHFLGSDLPLFGLVRSTVGWLLLDRSGCDNLARLTRGEMALPQAGWLGRLTQRRNPIRAQAETAARRVAIARAARPFLGRLLRHLPPESRYFNVGHSNLGADSLAALAPLQPVVLIHDTIPLDHPHLARPDTVEPFRQRLAAVAAHASAVIHLTKAQRRLTEAQLARLGRVPPAIVAPLGVTVATPAPTALPPGLSLERPWFLCLGTIEPRKNHDLLLDIWAQLGPDAPQLFIVGHLGWAAAATRTRLQALPPDGPVRVLSGLSDGAVAALMSGAAALLAPSLAEGFGLPPIEAAILGTPVIATDLAVTREMLGDKAVYLDPADIYSWLETIRRAAGTTRRDAGRQEYIAPTWAAHFKTVLSLAG